MEHIDSQIPKKHHFRLMERFGKKGENSILDMKKIDTWIPKKYYNMIEERARKKKESKYKVSQALLMKALDDEKQKDLSLSVAFWFLCYSLIVATIIQLI